MLLSLTKWLCRKNNIPTENLITKEVIKYIINGGTIDGDVEIYGNVKINGKLSVNGEITVFK